MALKLIPSGKRKGNKFYLIFCKEGRRQYEYSTRTADKAVARARLEELRQKLARAPRAGARVTFAKAAELDKAWRSPSAADEKRVDKVVAVLGRDPVAEI
jgi:hypothetical protein